MKEHKSEKKQVIAAHTHNLSAHVSPLSPHEVGDPAITFY